MCDIFYQDEKTSLHTHGALTCAAIHSSLSPPLSLSQLLLCVSWLVDFFKAEEQRCWSVTAEVELTIADV